MFGWPCARTQPDIQPYNANDGIVNTLEPAAARVYHTGDVRPSHSSAPLASLALSHSRPLPP